MVPESFDRLDAIAWYQAITDGAGVDRLTALSTIRRGWMAEAHWDDTLFVLGIEYGVLIALVELYQLTPDDVGHALGPLPPRMGPPSRQHLFAPTIVQASPIAGLRYLLISFCCAILELLANLGVPRKALAVFAVWLSRLT